MPNPLVSVLYCRSVNAFSYSPEGGNPAAVCILQAFPNDSLMQKAASKIGFSETAFVVPDGNHFRLRWFTPECEVDLCGHATLASAHILWQEQVLDSAATAVFETRSGKLSARKTGGWIEMDLPSDQPRNVEIPEALRRALGKPEILETGRGKCDYVVLLKDEDAVKRLTPDFAMLKTVKTRGVIVTAEAQTGPYDFVSRFFAPAAGIEEDPVTGSAHCLLAYFWQARTGRGNFSAHQISQRGGEVRVRIDSERVFLSGEALTTGTFDLSVREG